MIGFLFASFPDDFETVRLNVEKEYNECGVFFLNEDYIRALNSKTSAFALTEPELICAARTLSENAEAAKYTLFVCRAMEDRELLSKHLKYFEFPDREFPFLAILAFLPSIEKIHSNLCNLGLPDEVVLDTLRQFEDCMFLYEERFGCLGLNKRYFDHLQRYVDGKILNIGRLRFELYKNKDVYLLESRKTGKQILFVDGERMNSDGLYADTPPIKENCTGFDAFLRENETSYIGTPIGDDGKCKNFPIELDKSEYFMRVGKGDDIIAVHIPAKGALTREACEKSYDQAKEIFKSIYPECDFKAFRCHSWMMAPELRDILKPGSNLLEFQSPYKKYPSHTKGEDVLNFVFKMKFTSYNDLPEDTSLQRALKKIYLSGGYLYEYSGLFTI